MKKTASPRRELVEPFKALERLKMPIGQAAVLCLCENIAPLSENIDALPVGII